MIIQDQVTTLACTGTVGGTTTITDTTIGGCTPIITGIPIELIIIPVLLIIAYLLDRRLNQNGYLEDL
tara:strand:- start:380 stop:583 length:204 start_codon:yes stop_codon:yes gene_type:complete